MGGLVRVQCLLKVKESRVLVQDHRVRRARRRGLLLAVRQWKRVLTSPHVNPIANRLRRQVLLAVAWVDRDTEVRNLSQRNAWLAPRLHVLQHVALQVVPCEKGPLGLRGGHLRNQNRASRAPDVEGEHHLAQSPTNK